jgi:hypothetical protein
MRRAKLLSLLLASACFAAIAAPATTFAQTTTTTGVTQSSGEVVLKSNGCDDFIVEDASGDYAVLEWYGGRDPDRGDQLVGDWKQFGFTTVIDVPSGSSTRVWVEDHWLTRTKAIDVYTKHCS